MGQNHILARLCRQDALRLSSGLCISQLARLKATKEQKHLQIVQVMEWLVEGLSRAEILQESHKLWGYSVDSPTTVDELISRARKEFVKHWENVARKEMVSESMCRFDKLYRLGIQQRQLAVSHAAEMAKCKLIGLDKGF